MEERVTIPALHKMKREGRKIVGVVAWDYQMAQIVDRAGVEIISVGDTIGINLYGQPNPLEVTFDQMLTAAQAVRRGVKRALMSIDLPFGPLQEGVESAVRAAIRFVKEAGADLVKLDGAAEYPEAVRALVKAGIPVFSQFGMTPQSAHQYGVEYQVLSKGGATLPAEMRAKLVEEAKMLEEAGSALLDFTNSGPVAGEAVTKAVALPVIGGFGGGPWLDGRMRAAHAAIGYGAASIDAKGDNYANVARIALEAISAYAEDVRGARQIKGAAPK